MTRTARRAVKIDVIVDSGHWKDADRLKSVVRRAVTRALAATPSTTATELAIVLTDDSAIRLLNRNWRGIDAATNVLSFPAKNAPARCPGGHLGDIVLAFETIVREARAEHKPLAHHVAHLAVHGFLHLVGYDHEKDDAAREMEDAERNILRQLEIPDPYRLRVDDSRRYPAKRRRAKRRSARRRHAGRDAIRSAKNPAGRPRKS